MRNLKIALALGTVLAASAAVSAQAQVASLVRDITPQEPSDIGPAANPLVLSAAGNRLVFLADDDALGYELWTSDGTVNGTEILTDACSGRCGSSGRPVATTRDLSFWVLGSALWRSDGTRAGTFPIAGSVPESVRPPWPVRGNILYYPSCEAFVSCTLWRTDGTPAGSRQVLDLRVRSLALVGNRVLIATEDELWRLDPGSETPVRVASVANAIFLGPVQDRLLMIVADATGQELWSTDGTPAGTRALTKFANADPFGYERRVVATSRRVYIVADDVEHGNELWASDGTPQGTKRITDFGYYFPFNYDVVRTLQEVGERVVFQARDGLSDGVQLWSTDGRPESTTKLLEPCPRECNDQSEDQIPFRTARAGNTVLFPAVDPEHGIELWTTDGTVAGTRLFKDLCPGSCDFETLFIPAVPAPSSTGAGGIYFSGQNHLWWTDGTAAGTRRLTRKPLFPQDLVSAEVAAAGGKLFLKLGDSHRHGSLALLEDGNVRPLTFEAGRASGTEIVNLIPEGSRLHFQTFETYTARGLWQSEGTAATTRLISPDFDSIEGTVSAGGVTYFFEGGHDLWRFTEDGGILRLAPIRDQYGSDAPQAAALGNLLFFPATLGEHTSLWKTDGTVAGTTEAQSFPEDRHLHSVAASGGRLYLSVTDDYGFARLRAGDGSAAGMKEILILGEGEQISGLFVHAGRYDYFSTVYGYGGVHRLWRTDGTAAGTAALSLSPEPVRFDRFVEHKGSLFVLGEDYDYPAGTAALWKVDGDTVLRLGSFGSHAAELELASVGNLVLFNVDDGEHGVELWATDGTVAGTRMVRDLVPGSLTASVSQLTVAGGRLYFTARDTTHGLELWQSDGTAAGTRLVHDVNPGPASSRPQELTVASGRLYFSADDGLTGRELWMLPLTGGAACQPSASALCLRDRFRVEISWRDFQEHLGTGAAVPVTGDTGYFWFFDPANAEVVLKVLDGRGVNDHFWVFYGALSTVEYTMTVTDTATGLTSRYLNPLGQLASLGDTTAFGPGGAFAIRRSRTTTAPPSPPTPVRSRTSPEAATGACTPGPQRLCLNGGRFAVEASWKDFAGKTGKGQAMALSADTGYFWFFDAANVEVLLKVLDGSPVNGKFWVFYGALSNVEYTLTVTDTQTGEIKEYRNPSGQFASVADTGAF